jgi:predicted Fe-S protein YdhL (DUF1289 family)
MRRYLRGEIGAKLAEMTSYVLSPCQKACGMDPDLGHCRGCLRTGQEIWMWSSLTREQQVAAVERLKKEKARRRRKRLRRQREREMRLAAGA